ncbi:MULTISPECIES: AraC family transcriptional regulator [Chitinophaga]|uniref:helix-turn-helix domain-containing protein n=1 Tax=Chitinophaga TaxID=79328 RepID=UPI000BB08E2E|nr:MULTISPECIES: AraC family transcriptional regulator [Chitinophaga]ASZ14407.1 AraC family transcriptional regulator [Chitinophaga sp. MD30]
MQTTVLHVKNMVCPRCIKAVRSVIEEAGLTVQDAQLGKVHVTGSISEEQRRQLDVKLQAEGFELMDDRKQQVAEAIKNIIVETVHYGDLEEMKENFSSLLAQRLNKDYHYLSNLFSEQEGTTIEQYIIQQKIERVKELLEYDELTLSQISYKLGYSSVAHLSGQFKKVTGMTPSQFKQLQEHKRRPLDKI